MPLEPAREFEEYLLFERDPAFRKAIEALKEDPEAIAAKFNKRISFGTAGLRGPMEAGIKGMNSGTVWRASQGLCEYFSSKGAAAGQKVVVGFDGRHNSEYFASITAAVFMTKGFQVIFADEVTATPITPYLIVKHGAVCGVQVTASHNPKDDNGYKVYAGNGAQIITPMDKEIAQMIEEQHKPWSEVDELVDHHLKRFNPIHPKRLMALQQLTSDWQKYKTDVCKALKIGPKALESSKLKIVYTAMHGVGYRYVRDLIVDTLGFPQDQFVAVKEQMHPDPEFPTVRFPNPEEQGALDLAKATAQATGANLIIANDPDADRFAAVEVRADGSLRTFTGDELGTLFGAISYENMKGTTTKPLSFVCSAVSSKFFDRFSKNRVGETCYRETLTGFKWMVNVSLKARDEEGWQPCFCYEEALGYGLCVETVPDKCGLSAAAAMVKKASELHAQGQTLEGWLEQLMVENGGYFATDNSYFVAKDPSITKAIIGQFREKKYASELGGYKVSRVRDLAVNYDSATADHKCELPAGDEMLTLEFENGGRLTIRGSGTEPKLKYYSELVSATSIADAKAELQKMVSAVLKEVMHPYQLVHASEQ